ncbi:hypothetical protein R6Q59_034896 [Mikania micrantha]
MADEYMVGRNQSSKYGTKKSCSSAIYHIRLCFSKTKIETGLDHTHEAYILRCFIFPVLLLHENFIK